MYSASVVDKAISVCILDDRFAVCVFRTICMWAQLIELTCFACVSDCRVCSHANQPDRCTQFLFHAGHVYTETHEPSASRPTVRGDYCGDLAIARGSQSTTPRCPIARKTNAKGILNLVSTDWCQQICDQTIEGVWDGHTS
jgi:hypothetical protein